MTKHSKPADAWNPWSTYVDALDAMDHDALAAVGIDRSAARQRLGLGRAAA
jgi:hypothetical protein